jgi:hypothetical protein
MGNGDTNDTRRAQERPANWNGDSAAMRALEETYGEAVRAGTLHAHELRQRDPKLYESLAQFFSRNKARDMLPAAFADVMPVDAAAKNGWKTRVPPPPPSAEEALAILLKQRAADRRRKQRYRRDLALRRLQAATEDDGNPTDDAIERPDATPGRETSTPKGPRG